VNHNETLLPPIARGMPLNHNETVLPPIAHGIPLNHNETLLARAGLAPAVGAAGA